MRKGDVDKLVNLFALWSGLRGKVVLEEGDWRLCLPGRDRTPGQPLGGYLAEAIWELLLLAGGSLDHDALRMLTLAGRSRGWAGMVEGAKALGVLRKYGFFLGQGVKDGERVPVA